MAKGVITIFYEIESDKYRLDFQQQTWRTAKATIRKMNENGVYDIIVFEEDEVDPLIDLSSYLTHLSKLHDGNRKA